MSKKPLRRGVIGPLSQWMGPLLIIASALLSVLGGTPPRFGLSVIRSDFAYLAAGGWSVPLPLTTVPLLVLPAGLVSLWFLTFAPRFTFGVGMFVMLISVYSVIRVPNLGLGNLGPLTTIVGSLMLLVFSWRRISASPESRLRILIDCLMLIGAWLICLTILFMLGWRLAAIPIVAIFVSIALTGTAIAKWINARLTLPSTRSHKVGQRES